MACGVPLVVLNTPEAMETSAAMLFEPLFEGKTGTPEEQSRTAEIFTPSNDLPVYPLVETIDQYIDRAVALIENVESRRASGLAGKRFFEEFFRDEQRFAETVTNHILEIIEDVRHKRLSAN